MSLALGDDNVDLEVTEPKLDTDILNFHLISKNSRFWFLLHFYLKSLIFFVLL